MNKSEARDAIIIEVISTLQSIVSNNSMVLVDLITELALDNKLEYKKASHWLDMFNKTNREANEKLEKLLKKAEEVENE